MFGTRILTITQWCILSGEFVMRAILSLLEPIGVDVDGVMYSINQILGLNVQVGCFIIESIKWKSLTVRSNKLLIDRKIYIEFEGLQVYVVLKSDLRNRKNHEASDYKEANSKSNLIYRLQNTLLDVKNWMIGIISEVVVVSSVNSTIYLMTVEEDMICCVEKCRISSIADSVLNTSMKFNLFIENLSMQIVSDDQRGVDSYHDIKNIDDQSFISISSMNLICKLNNSMESHVAVTYGNIDLRFNPRVYISIISILESVKAVFNNNSLVNAMIKQTSRNNFDQLVAKLDMIDEEKAQNIQTSSPSLIPTGS